MKKVVIKVEMTAQEAKDKFVFELPDDATPEDIDTHAQEVMVEWVDQLINAEYEVIKVINYKTEGNE